VDLATLLDILTLEPLGNDRFVGNSQTDRLRNVFGGQFLAQSILAAAATCDGGVVPHSLHGSFLRGASTQRPLRIDVERVRDGRAFRHRSVSIQQTDDTPARTMREVFRAMVSFHVPTPGAAWDDPADVPGDPGIDPATLPSYVDWAEAGTDHPEHDFYSNRSPVEQRYERPPSSAPGTTVQGRQKVWMRLPGPVPDDPTLHVALFAWMSDLTLADFTSLAHGRRWTDSDTNTVSLDHAMWFHAPARADDWVCFTQRCSTTGAGRGLSQGEVHTRSGRRIASCSQEVLLTLPDGVRASDR
jgi:acyl-CoA thioesterase-2